MARQKLENRNIRKIQKSGNGSYYISLPAELVRKYRWKEGQKLVVEEHPRKRLIIKDWPASPKRRSGGPASPKRSTGGKT